MRKYFLLLLFAFLALTLSAQDDKVKVLPPAGTIAKPPLEESDPSRILPEKYDSNRIGLVERFGNQIPGELEFYNHRGEKKPLSAYLDGPKAIVLNLIYFNCPSICNETLNSLTQAMGNLPWEIGDQFKVLTVSIDPREQHPLAARKRISYLEYYGKPVDHDNWIFLTGQKEEIQVLADSVGFGYEYQEETGEYAHPAVTILLSPDGRVMRYLEGMVVTPLNLKLGLVESGQGKVGNSIDRALLRYCYAYDAEARGYSLMAKKVMTGGGAITLLVMASVMFVLWRREFRTGGLK